MARAASAWGGAVLGWGVLIGPSYAGADRYELSAAATFAATSDYVYRGVSLHDEKPTGMLYLEATYGPFYANALLIGTDLGRDGLGRSLGSLEADATVGVKHTIGNVDFNGGIKYTGYPNGRDLVADSLDKAERDFLEPFAGATLNLGERASLGATFYWTPDYYYETGEVTTLEGQGAIVLPPLGPVNSRFTATVGRVWSEQDDVVSPGRGYLYYNAGIEGRLEQILFDLRYWNTDVESIDGFEQRFVLSVGIEFK